MADSSVNILSYQSPLGPGKNTGRLHRWALGLVVTPWILGVGIFLLWLLIKAPILALGGLYWIGVGSLMAIASLICEIVSAVNDWKWKIRPLSIVWGRLALVIAIIIADFATAFGLIYAAFALSG